MTASRSDRRAARRHQRAASPFLLIPFRQPRNPWRPAEWLAPDQLDRLHDASVRILEDVGLDVLDAEALVQWERAGARVDHAAQHIWLDRGLVMALVAKAPARFTWRARNPARSLEIGGNAITFGPSGGMAYASDLERGRRPGTHTDYEDFVRLAHLCNALHVACCEQVTSHDVPVALRHLHRLRSGFTLSDKAVVERAHGRAIIADNLEMARRVFGAFDGDPVIGAVISPDSPLRFDHRLLGGLMANARAGQVTIVSPFVLAGATRPVSIAAALAQQNAEALAVIALTQVVRPGAPVIYGGLTSNVDMQSGRPAFGTPEGAWALMVGAQLARRYRLPYHGSGSPTTAKIPDGQAAYETQWALWPCVLVHANVVMHAAGSLEGGLTASFEKFVLDAEALAMFQHLLGGFTIDESTLALDMMAEVGPGGHHFGTPHTQARFQTEFYQTFLADRQGYENWASVGSADTAQRAHDLYKELLAQYEAPPLDPGIAEALDDFVARRTRELEGVDLYE
jgi:trimethylamine--corrinoid protein Co-methyltransferase